MTTENSDPFTGWITITVSFPCTVHGHDHGKGTGFRHGTHFQRWRPDKPPSDCRYDQLEETPALEIAQIFGT